MTESMTEPMTAVVKYSFSKELTGHDIVHVNTFSMSYAEMTGLPCRIIAEIAQS